MFCFDIPIYANQPSALQQEPEGIRTHIEEFSRCKDFWNQLHTSMTEYYRSSTQLQSAEVALAYLLSKGSTAEKEPSSSAIASIAEAHQVDTTRRCMPKFREHASNSSSQNDEIIPGHDFGGRHDLIVI